MRSWMRSFQMSGRQRTGILNNITNITNNRTMFSSTVSTSTESTASAITAALAAAAVEATPTSISTNNSSTSNQQQQPLTKLQSELNELEKERTRQRIILEELGQQQMDIVNRMNTITNTLEELDTKIELKEEEILVVSSAISGNIQVKTEPQTIVKSEKVKKEIFDHIDETSIAAATATATATSTMNHTTSNEKKVQSSKSQRSRPITNIQHQTTGINTVAVPTWTQQQQQQVPAILPIPIQQPNKEPIYDDDNEDPDEILTDPRATMTALTMTSPKGGGGYVDDEYLTECTPRQNYGNHQQLQPHDDDDFQLYDDDDEGDDYDSNRHESFVPRQQQQYSNNIDFYEATSTANNAARVTTTASSNDNDTSRQQSGQNQAEIVYPWTKQMLDLLHHSFRIPNFREQQKDIIDATMMGHDVFVIMRTGGGKSLTYQLPALYEGRYNRQSNSKKITLVISPLLSLIQDQEEQMNQIAPGSAISFTSSIGTAEHTKRWEMVRDSNSGVCIIFCTPEKVSKSNRLCSELDKLHAHNRLGRFVIDEAHCACQWGHDFRPDYVKLGKLKMHFPSIPIIAVTATASDRVRNDVCEILQLRDNYRFFRSTFARPNLIYSIVPKPDQKNTVIEMMADFIRTKYPNDAGIVYTYSRKDADTVADALVDYGVIAEPYHSDVSAAKKEAVHRSWMRNETQVVVATIAFGLGINKPDVRFVLHHSISKTLEAYYQESGRAGRDGNQSECVLYYNPKDVMKMMKMVHGTSSEHLVWPMVRYAQQSGNDAICKSILLTHLGEPNAPDVMKVVNENEGVVTIRRDVGKHAKTVVQLLYARLQQDANVTMSMLVKDWRSTGASAEQCVKDNPPAKDGLSSDDCERIITSLLLENVLATNPIWNAYDTIIYLILGEFGPNMLKSTNPKFIIRLPIREGKTSGSQTTAASKQSSIRKSVASDGEWLATKSKAVKRKKATTVKVKQVKKGKKVKLSKTANTKDSNKKMPAKSKNKNSDSIEVIELSSDDDTEPDVPLVSLKRGNATALPGEQELWKDDGSDTNEEDSDEEYEFEE